MIRKAFSCWIAILLLAFLQTSGGVRPVVAQTTQEISSEILEKLVGTWTGEVRRHRSNGDLAWSTDITIEFRADGNYRVVLGTTDNTAPAPITMASDNVVLIALPTRIDDPAKPRKFKISSDGTTLTASFKNRWEGKRRKNKITLTKS